MTKITKVAFTALFGMAMLSTTATASITKGQKYYSKKIKGQCNDLDGGAFADKHTQAEWTSKFKSGDMEATVRTICPDLGKYKSKWTKHLFQFAHEYASDGLDPEC